ncbi:MAG TPA: DUF2252 domain-containing protein [Burkholderiales bacterium]|nr:DUF2252 domain-containing protein [Burkholderiales bacterium]
MAKARTRKQSRGATGRRGRARHTAALPTRGERAAIGRALRDKAPRKSHGDWKLPRDHRDPIRILEASNRGRLPELVPIRYGRMLHSPFTFLRGSAAVMAYDLAKTPTSGLQVQACGDCHLMNFGLFATPERNLVFDVNDFDETHPGPWEWDLKRLAASFVIAARDNALPAAQARDVVMECASAYREHMRECSAMTPMEVWYQRLDMETLIEQAPDAEARKFRQQLAKQARQRIIEHLFPKIVAVAGGQHRLVDQPPILVHVKEPEFEERVYLAVSAYRQSLSDERRVLLDRYRLEDFALKVVGIGSVGTRCYIALLMSDEHHPLMLQFKEAGRSVLEPYTGRSKYDNQGERVVMGQRLMQSSSDIFLGWVRGRRGKDFYVRQLRDMKMSVPLEGLSADRLARYATACGWTLARAHAKSGDATAISGYLGKAAAFDRALARFGSAYADQTERDHAALIKAVRSGRVEALTDE